MASGGARVHIYGDWDGSGVKKAKEDLNLFERQASGFSDGIKSSFIGMGAAIGGAFAATKVVDFFQSSMNAAMDDQKAVESLRQTLVNVGQGFQSVSVEGFIDSLSRANGIADDVLRPSFQRLVTATNDVGKAQDALKLAMDISAGTGKTVEEVSTALSAAYAGNYTAISRLKTGIDSTVIASHDMGAITDALSQKFAGQASVAADTFKGKMDRVTVAANEAKETIGYALLNALDAVANSMGGAGGASQMIQQTGDEISTLIDLSTQLITKLKGVKIAQDAENDAGAGSSGWIEYMVSRLPMVGGALVEVMNAQQRSGKAAIVASGALAAESGRYAGLAANANAAAAAIANANAVTASHATASRYTAMAVKQYGADISYTGGTMAAWKSSLNDTSAALKDIGGSGGGGSAGGASAAVQKLGVVWKQTAADVNAALDGMSIAIKGKAVEASGAMVDEFTKRQDAFKKVIEDQGKTITDARKALDDYAKSVTSTVLGNIQFSAKNADGTDMGAQQWMDSLIASIKDQKGLADAISAVTGTIPEAIQKKLLEMAPAQGIAFAKFIADPANSALVTQLTTDYNALGTFTETTLGVPMAAAFATVGGQSAVSMIESAKVAIAAESAAFRHWVRSQLQTDITVHVNYDTSGAPVGARAFGGPVSSGMPYLIGERGPELFVPSASGTVVPNNALGSGSGGNTYSITVQAGVGDPRQIGQQVVEYIKRYESANGPVFKAA